MKTAELSGFNIIGISVRTTNENGKSLKDIGELFGQFLEQNIIQKIPGKVNNDVYCVYTEYESDYNASYTTFIGCKVTALEKIPPGLVGKVIHASKYQVYKSTGKLSESLRKTWEAIWASEINRKYEADFDIYGVKAADFNNAEVETYVSVN